MSNGPIFLSSSPVMSPVLILLSGSESSRLGYAHSSTGTARVLSLKNTDPPDTPVWPRCTCSLAGGHELLTTDADGLLFRPIFPRSNPLIGQRGIYSSANTKTQITFLSTIPPGGHEVSSTSFGSIHAAGSNASAGSSSSPASLAVSSPSTSVFLYQSSADHTAMMMEVLVASWLVAGGEMRKKKNSRKEEKSKSRPVREPGVKLKMVLKGWGGETRRPCAAIIRGIGFEGAQQALQPVRMSWSHRTFRHRGVLLCSRH